MSMNSNFIIKELKSKKLNKLCTGHRTVLPCAKTHALLIPSLRDIT